jgi:hypothetical protein
MLGDQQPIANAAILEEDPDEIGLRSDLVDDVDELIE